MSERFKELLESEHRFPCTYTFKFVVPKDKLPDLEAIFDRDTLKTRESKTGKYISVTIDKYVINADEIVGYYEECSEIQGLISL